MSSTIFDHVFLPARKRGNRAHSWRLVDISLQAEPPSLRCFIYTSCVIFWTRCYPWHLKRQAEMLLYVFRDQQFLDGPRCICTDCTIQKKHYWPTFNLYSATVLDILAPILCRVWSQFTASQKNHNVQISDFIVAAEVGGRLLEYLVAKRHAGASC